MVATILVARCMSLLVWVRSLERALRVGCGGCAPKDAARGCAPVETSVALWGEAVFDTCTRGAGGGASTTVSFGSSAGGSACSFVCDCGACPLDNGAASPAVADSASARGEPDASLGGSTGSAATEVAAERAARSPAVAATVLRGDLPPRAFADLAEGERVATLSPRFQNFDRRQLLALEEFEEGAAARRNIADLVMDAVLGDRRERVAAACNRERRRLGDRVSQRLRAVAELVEFEYADRAVPHDRAGFFQLGG